MKKVRPLPTALIIGAVIILSLIAIPFAFTAVTAAAAHPACLAPMAAIPLLGMAAPVSQEEFQRTVLRGMNSMREELDSMRGENTELKKRANEDFLRNANARRSGISTLAASQPRGFGDFGGAATPRPKGKISDEAAAELAATWILQCARKGAIENFIRDEHQRARVLDMSKEIIGLGTRSLSTTEIPLPTNYSGELMELIAEFGVVRKAMTSYPITGGTSRPPRMGTRPAFGSIAMAAEFAEKKPTITFASLESHKIGGLVITPREIDEQSIVGMGQFLAMYGAVEFARAEDTWGFLADGTSTYENVVGICKTCVDNSLAVTLGSGLTHPSDAVLADFRSLRSTVSSAAISGGAYYINQTFETRLRNFKTTAEPDVFAYRPDGTATLDGFPIVWTEVLQPYGTGAAVSKFIAAFGKMRFWFFGQRGQPRIDTSADVYFTSDQLATRFIEEIDFDYSALNSMAVMRTAAS